MVCWRAAYLAGWHSGGLNSVKFARRAAKSACLAAIGVLSACAASQPPVIENLDELTGVTVTHSRTPLLLSPQTESPGANAREFVQIGVIEINRMGTLEYFLWLGIWDRDNLGASEPRPDAYSSIVIMTGNERIPLDIHGWSSASIGTSERIYKKIFSEDLDAYYAVSLEQIRMLATAIRLEVETTGVVPKKFVPWYNQEQGQEDLQAFLSAVTF